MGWAFSLGGSHASCGLQGGHIHKTKPEAEYLIKNRAIWLKGLLWVHCVSSFPSFSLFCFPPFLPPPTKFSPSSWLPWTHYSMAESSITMFFPTEAPERIELPWLRPWDHEPTEIFPIFRGFSWVFYHSEIKLITKSIASTFPLLAIIHYCVFLKMSQNSWIHPWQHFQFLPGAPALSLHSQPGLDCTSPLSFSTQTLLSAEIYSLVKTMDLWW